MGPNRGSMAMDSGDLKCREVKTGFAERVKCKPVLLKLSLAEYLEKPLMSLYGTEWRERVAIDGQNQMMHL